MELLIVPVILGLAAVVQGATGFGFGLTAVATLGLFSDIKDASVVMAFGGLCLILTMLWKLRRHITIRPVIPLIISSMISIPFGVRFLANADRTVLGAILGAVLLAAVVRGALPKHRQRPWHPIWMGIPLGVLSGLLSGALGTGGPPVVAFIASQDYGRLKYAAMLQVVLGMNSVIRIEELTRQGLLTRELFLQGAIGAIFVVIGALVGVRILHRLTDTTLRRCVNVLLLLLALRYLSALVI
jgi:uncharacterized protein